MTASPVYANKKKAIDAWEDTLLEIDYYFDTIIGFCFEHIEDVLRNKILNSLYEENKSIKYEEKIFDYYKRLMWYYYDTIEIYKENNQYINDYKIKQIIGGICSVLLSQIKQFEEYQNEKFNYSTVQMAINPIKKEKEDSISDSEEYLHSLISELLSKLRENKKIFSKTNTRKTVIENITQKKFSGHTDCCKDIYFQITNNLDHAIYGCYTKAFSNFSEKLNSSKENNLTLLYFDLLKEERENLSSIIKIQVAALENQMKERLIPIVEEQSVQLILSSLREAHQHLGKEIEEIIYHYKDIDNINLPPLVINIDDFITLLEGEGFEVVKKILINTKSAERDLDDIFIDIQLCYNIFVEIFLHIFSAVTQQRTDSLNISFFIKNLKKETFNILGISKDMIYCFSTITKYYDNNLLKYENDDKYSDSENRIENINASTKSESNNINDLKKSNESPNILFLNNSLRILKGIQDTLKIKIESITDSVDIFVEEMNELIDTFKNEQFTINDTDIANIMSNLNTLTANKMCDFKLPLNYQNAIIVFDDLISQICEFEKLINYEKSIKEQLDSITEKFTKKLNKYLKDYLLFEVTTFEELMNYSVEKLREDSNGEVAKYVSCCDDIWMNLKKILNRNNIDIISPKPHDAFNGKEYEALVAEKNTAFQKGEVIKSINSGFKYKDAILMRANVIAAK